MTTRDDVRRAALDSPILNVCIQMHQHNQCTWEEAMMIAAVNLAAQNNFLEEKLMEATMKLPPAPVIVDKNVRLINPSFKE